MGKLGDPSKGEAFRSPGGIFSQLAFARGGISEIGFPIEITYQNFDILRA
jgi:hypothetical protein